MKIALYSSIIVLLLLLCAFFASCDTAYTSVNVLRLEKAAKHGNKKAKRVLTYVNDYDKTISAILFGNDLASIASPVIGTLLAYAIWGESFEYGPTIISIILVFLVLLFGEIIPKALAKIYSYPLALFYVNAVTIIRVIFYPFVWVTTGIAKLAKPIAKKNPEDDAPLSDDELSAMVDDIEEEGVIDESQSELIHKSIEFKETTAEEIMTPRVDIVGYNTEHSFAEWVKEPGVLRHSRIIVYRKYFDRIIGYIPTKELLKAMLDGDVPDYRKLLLPIIAVPSTMEVSSVLKLMKKSHHHIAVVKDEYGGTDGILTLEDILEELVGELYDESEAIHLDVIPTKKKNVFLVSGKMGIHDFFDRFNLDQDEVDEDYNTVSGWVIDHLGRFAELGDHFSYDKVDVSVSKASEYVVEQLEVSYHPRRKKKKD